MAKKSKKPTVNQKPIGSIRVKDKSPEVQERYRQFRDRKFKTNMSLFGTALGLASRHILKQMGHDVDFKINGEDIMKLKHLAPPDLEERIKLAIQEERYEDAAKIRDLIKQLPK